MARYSDVGLVGTDARSIEKAFDRALHDERRTLRGAPSRCGAEESRALFVGVRLDDEWSAVERPLAGTWKPPVHPQVVIDQPRGPQEQMDIDTEWAIQVVRGARPATLRFWRWTQPAVVIGRYQCVHDEVDLEAARAAGFQIVKRPTGGGAMFVRPSDVITYSLYVPAPFLEGVAVRASYRLCDRWLVEALRGMDIGFRGMNDVVTPNGKAGGSAQRRYAPLDHGPCAVLHHTTLSYAIDSETMSRLLRVSDEKMSDKAVRSVSKRVDPLCMHTALSREEIMHNLAGYAHRGI